MKEAAPREGVKFGVRRLAWYAGGFSGGVYLAQYLLTGPWLLWAGLMSLALGVLTLFLPLDGSAGVVRRRSVILCAALAAGLGWSWLYVRQAQRPAEELTGWTGPIEAEALDYPTKNDYTTRVLVRLEGVRAYLYGVPMDVTPGQRIMGTAELRDASRIREDDITTFTSKGVFLLAYGKGAMTIEAGTSASPRWYPLRLGRAMQGKLFALFPEDTAGVLAALLTGERSLIPETVSADFNEAGLSHVLAVSGMHCGVLLAFLTRLTGKGRGRVWTALPILVFYALLTGCRPSVVRACVMIGFLLIGPLFRRESDPPTALLTALMLILAQNPFAAASAGLQLSFASVAGLLWLTPKLNAGLPKGVRKPKTFRDCLLWLLRKILQSFCVTAGALVFTIPLMAWRFGTIAIIAPLSNLLCLPAVWALFCLGLMSAAAGLVFFPLGGLLAIPAEYLCRWILLVSGWLARIPGHAVYLNNPFLKYWLLYTYALFAAACLFRGTPRRRYALAGALACLTLVLTVRLGAARYRSDLDILMLDVGQGQSVALASGGHFALVDCGSANSWLDPSAAALKQLRTMGCGALEALILTHSDSDHVSGVPKLLAQMEVKRLLLSGKGDWAEIRGAARKYGVQVEVLTEKQEMELGQSRLTVFPPVTSGEDNDSGLSVLAAVGEKEFLLTGDMSAAAEKRLLETWDLPDIEGCAAGHHGSKYSSSDEFLTALRPETVCISVGSNSYGHPAEETLARLEEHGCGVFRTDLEGIIHLSWNREGAYGDKSEAAEEE